MATGEHEVESQLAVVVARLDDVRGDIASLRTELVRSRQDMVSKGEWEMRNKHVDSRFESQGGEISALSGRHDMDVALLRKDIERVDGKGSRGWTIAAAVAAVISLGLAVFSNLPA